MFVHSGTAQNAVAVTLHVSGHLDIRLQFVDRGSTHRRVVMLHRVSDVAGQFKKDGFSGADPEEQRYQVVFGRDGDVG